MPLQKLPPRFRRETPRRLARRRGVSSSKLPAHSAGLARAAMADEGKAARRAQRDEALRALNALAGAAELDPAPLRAKAEAAQALYKGPCAVLHANACSTFRNPPEPDLEPASLMEKRPQESPF